MGKRITLEERLTQYEVQPNGCWHWQGSVNKQGYSMIYARVRGKFTGTGAHRIFYEEHVEAIPEGLVIDHVCHNTDAACPGGIGCLHRRCVNPNHLQAVTQHTNVMRGRGLAALNAVKEYCPEGHAYTTTNTYIEPNGGRQCIACRKKTYKRYYDTDKGGDAARERARVRMRELRKDPAYKEYKNARERERYIRRQAEKGKVVTARPSDRVSHKEHDIGKY